MPRDSTHDWTTTPGPGGSSNTELSETWVDAKSPGDGFTYLVGSIDVRDTIDTPTQPSFSGVKVGLPPGIGSGPSFQFLPTGAGMVTPHKQVAILQCVDGDGAIDWQVYFYGWTTTLPLLSQYRRRTCARAISVWAGPTPSETRIAICGEQSDDAIPLSQAPGGWIQSPSTIGAPNHTGFIAIYNGRGALLWTHHFFGDTQGLNDTPDCAITDVSIRVEGSGENARDVVTYCGISSWGVPLSTNLPLYPKLPFSPTGCANSSGGITHHGTNQWDGVVGRLSHVHSNPAPGSQVQEFHSIVGGPGQDGLFGIAELEGQRFVAVGGAARLSLGTSAPKFPFTYWCGSDAIVHRVGVLMLFDASGTRVLPAQNLSLERATPIGHAGLAGPFDGPFATIARDVLVQFDYAADASVRVETLHVVGATNDPDIFDLNPLNALDAAMFSWVLTPFVGAQIATLNGPSDGFVMSFTENALQPDWVFLGGGYVGGDGHDGLTGVGSWNEHQDHLTVCGYSEIENNIDVQVATLFSNTSYEYVYDPGSNQYQVVWPTDPTLMLRRVTFGGSAEDRPAALGVVNATAQSWGGLDYLTGLELAAGTDNVGNPAGGGIAVDPRGRVTIGGRTRGIDYPVTVAPFILGTGPLGGNDAVRTQLDMLPGGVSRSDGTGTRFGTTFPLVPAPLPGNGYTGGTSPACTLTPFGRRVGETPPFVPRMMIEFDGINAPGETPSIVVTRPPNADSVLGTVLQYGFPNLNPPGPPPVGVIEFWMDPSTSIVLLAPYAGWDLNGTTQSWRFRFTVPLGDPSIPAPWNTMPICAQLVVLANCDPATWPCGSCDPATGLTLVASPALTFEF